MIGRIPIKRKILDYGYLGRRSIEIGHSVKCQKLHLRERFSCLRERARPPEDVGGVSGYVRLLEIIAEREDPEYAETIRWCGGYFDPDWFDRSGVDRDVRIVLRSNVKRRWYQPKPKVVPKK